MGEGETVAGTVGGWSPAGSVVMGLVSEATTQCFAEARPSRTGELAETTNGMPNDVVPAIVTGKDLQWNNSLLIKGDVADEASKLKQQPGGQILVAGSLRLVQGLPENGLVDELRPMAEPKWRSDSCSARRDGNVAARGSGSKLGVWVLTGVEQYGTVQVLGCADS